MNEKRAAENWSCKKTTQIHLTVMFDPLKCSAVTQLHLKVFIANQV